MPGSPQAPRQAAHGAVGWGAQSARAAQHTGEINDRNNVPLGSSLSLHITVSLCMSPCDTGLFIITECLDWPC